MAVHKFSVPVEIEGFETASMEFNEEQIDRYHGIQPGKLTLTLTAGGQVVLPLKASAEFIAQLVAFGGFPPGTSMTSIEVNPIFTTNREPRI